MISERTPRQRKPPRTAAAVCTIAYLGLASGCTWMTESRKKLDLGVDPSAGPYADSAAYRDTVGSMSYFEGMAPMHVRGYGLVVGLGDNGSSECPRVVFDRLVQDLYKQHEFTSSVVGVRTIKPERLIEHEDTAVVVVSGLIPPGAVRGTRFDVAVSALPGTQTKTLRGGRLYTAELEMYRAVSPDAAIAGRVLARASGPLFLNPFSEGEAATRSIELEGIILGGGEVLTDRSVRLVLFQPSYRWAQKIRDRINSLTAATQDVADAVSPSFVSLRVPSEYRDNVAHFLGLVRSLYLYDDSRFLATRAQALAKEIIHPKAPHARIALCFEAMGRTALPVLNDLYTHPRDYVSFHAAVAGLRLGDHIAADVLEAHAERVDGQYRFRAIRALGEARGMAGPAMCLRGLLDDPDPRVRIDAYQALLDRGDPVIQSHAVGGNNFMLDVVPGDGPNFIYVKRRESRRIALFGANWRCSPPLLYRAPDGSVVITAEPEAEELTILRVVPSTHSASPTIPAPLELEKLILLLGNDADVDAEGNVVGLGLEYGAVARALYHLAEAGAVNATFNLEQPNAAELFDLTRRRGRPESELPRQR